MIISYQIRSIVVVEYALDTQQRRNVIYVESHLIRLSHSEGSGGGGGGGYEMPYPRVASLPVPFPTVYPTVGISPSYLQSLAQFQIQVILRHELDRIVYIRSDVRLISGPATNEAAIASISRVATTIPANAADGRRTTSFIATTHTTNSTPGATATCM